MQAVGHGLHHHRDLGLLGDDTFGASFSLISVLLCLHDGSLEPTAGIRGDGPEKARAPVFLNGVKKCWAIPIEAIGHHIVEGEEACRADVPQHHRGRLELGPKLNVLRDLTLSASLHRPHVAALYPQRDGLDRFAFQGTELADRITKEMLPRLAPGKTLVEGFMKTPQFVK
jgi:hypothetical protein